MATVARDTSPDDADSQGTYDFLDVGGLKYGECTLVRFGDCSILIDGSHEKDFHGQEGHLSVPAQLKKIFRRDPPYDITLLVVTHGHADHIGCLPMLVSAGVIRPKFALITDAKLGFGRTQDDAGDDLANERTQALAAALREEDASDLQDSDLQEFIDTVATVESKYLAMIRDLERKHVRVIQYRGRPLPQELLDATRPANMTLLGPTTNQLVLAASQIAGTNDDAADAVRAALGQDAALSNVDLYRRLADLDEFDDVRNPRGSGMNCQSITLAFGPPSARVLLAGDMQFTEPSVVGADDEVRQLRRKVAAAGPYRVFKTTHHTSHNGQDADFLSELGNPPIVVHSGGRNDATHPDPGTLTMLKGRRRGMTFVRTDRHGGITVKPHLTGAGAVTVSHGRLNDFTSNADDPIGEPELEERAHGELVQVQAEQVRTAQGPQIVIVNLGTEPVQLTVAGVEITVGSASTSSTRIVSSVSPTRDARQPRRRELPPIQLANGRDLPKLLFVTNSERLQQNIGREEARGALDAIRSAGQAICDLAAAPGNAAKTVRDILRGDAKISGVVIAGGYDVVNAPIVDVLGAELREDLGADADRDLDRFLVWCDESFGDLDGDHIAERPVSRIPDARDPVLFFKALQAKSLKPAGGFGIRNVRRPFAEDVWTSVQGAQPLQVSERFLADEVSPQQTESIYQYFMLHGSNLDATLFTGEQEAGGSTRAFALRNVPSRFDGVVFTGCCWGALTVSAKAMDAPPNRTPAPRMPEESIALSYLKAGANAFIGCTGSHYSGPDRDADQNFAITLHSAFWTLLPKLGYAASPALFGARMHYATTIARSRWRGLDLARRLKNRAQFTCLGLGW